MQRRNLVVIELLLALSVVGTSGVAAQKTQKLRVESVAVVPNEKADQLRAQAEALHGDRKSARKAAAMHEREAQLRSEADPLAIEALDRAAQLYSSAGDHMRAEAAKRAAADRALRQGDVLRSAHAYLDAAFIALDNKDVERALSFARQADLLALSPLLTPSDRVAIVRRIDPARAQLGALGR
jgi:hypothetical protein